MTDTDTKATDSNPASVESSALERVIEATRQLPPDTTKDLLATLTKEALSGSITWSKNLNQTIDRAVERIDELISRQLEEILHDKSMQKLEGSWRGLNKLVRNSELGTQLKIKMIDLTKDELLDQFENAPSTDRCHLFNKVYQEEFGTAGGEPYGVLLGDYEFSHCDEDVALLRYMSVISAASHAPFIGSASSEVFGHSKFEGLANNKPIEAGFSASTYASWNAFRDSEDSRYVTLVLPRVLARLPYGKHGRQIKSFNFEEFAKDPADNERRPVSSEQFTWSNAVYEMGLLINTSFTLNGWCTAIRGLENGGKVENLPNYNYRSRPGDLIQQCPVEVNITDEREKELSNLGFLPMVHYKNSNFAVFMGAQTIQRPKEYIDADATANAAISARLPYIMASSRIAHYLKIMGRDRIGSSVQPEDLQSELTTWLNTYTNPNAMGNEARAQTPLAESQVTVSEQAGRPGCYSAVAYLRPWLQMEELTTSLRLVARIPG